MEIYGVGAWTDDQHMQKQRDHVFPVNLPQSIGKPKSAIRRDNDSVQWINILNQTPLFEMINGGISRGVGLQKASKGLLVNQGENENHVCEVNSFSPILLHFNKYASSMRPLLCGECGASTPEISSPPNVAASLHGSNLRGSARLHTQKV